MRAVMTRALPLTALAALVAAAPIPPAPTRWVDDHAAFLTPASQRALDTRLESYQRATGHQVVVWIGNTIEGTALDDWAVRTFNAWTIGRKGFDDGIAVFVLSDDRTIDIEVGYGLEDKVPDAVASRIIRDVMAPRLRAGDRDGAVTAGIDAVLASIEGQPWTDQATTATTTTTTTTTTTPQSGANTPSLTYWILGIIALVAFAIFAITHPRAAMLLLWTIASSTRRTGSHSGFGRGSGFGGGGGFRGGGGRSGGGGARGGW